MRCALVCLLVAAITCCIRSGFEPAPCFVSETCDGNGHGPLPDASVGDGGRFDARSDAAAAGDAMDAAADGSGSQDAILADAEHDDSATADAAIADSAPWYWPELAIDGEDRAIDISSLAVLDGQVFFQAADSTRGLELWRTDGTPAGTALFKDLWPGAGHGAPHSFVASGALVFFVASDGVSGEGLWRTDGTVAGTFRISDHRPVAPAPDLVQPLLGGLVFIESNPIVGDVVIWSDGTDAGTGVVAGACATGCTISSIIGATADRVLFAVMETVNGSEPYVYDGVTLQLLTDIVAAGGSYPSAGIGLPSGRFVFSAGDLMTTGWELWGSDGTAAGTALIQDLYPGNHGSLPNGFMIAGSAAYFYAREPTIGFELYRTDGTTAGTVLVKDIWPGSESGTGSPVGAFGSRLLLMANDGSGQQLWISDGSSGGTAPVAAIGPLAAGGAAVLGVDAGSLFFFVAATLASGNELWRTDGSAAGTRVIDLWPGARGSAPRALVALGNRVLFYASNGNGPGLFASDGTLAGTSRLQSVGASGGLAPAAPVVVGRSLVFVGSDPDRSSQLWATDGTSVGTQLLLDLNSSGQSISNLDRAMVGARLFFAAATLPSGQLFVTDGTGSGTSLVVDLGSGAPIEALVPLDDQHVFFAGYDDVHGWEPRLSDGTGAGTRIIREIAAGAASSMSAFEGAARLGGQVYFSASDTTSGQELWRTDGTDVGTMMVADLVPGAGGIQPRQLRSTATQIFFFCSQSNAIELWRSDGTGSGTLAVASGLHEGSTTQPGPLGALGPSLVFRGNNAAGGFAFWISDGTVAGTRQLLDPTGTDESWSCGEALQWGGVLYLVCDLDATGIELWRTDGTPAGTGLLLDLEPGAAGSAPLGLTVFDGALFFSAYRHDVGRELWVTDGTAAGTRPIDVLPGDRSAQVDALVVYRGELWFAARDLLAGNEWHRIRAR